VPQRKLVHKVGFRAQCGSDPDTAARPSSRHDDRAHDARPLRIGGFTPLTSLDYPGELAAVIFCQGCPWRCRYCHNRHLLPARCERPIAWTDIRSRLERRRGLLDAVVFSGGEPTLQAALPWAMEVLGAMGFKIGLHTAGPYPARLRGLLPYLDWVGLDIKALPADYPAITGSAGSGERAWKSLALLVDSGVELEVRTTVMPGWNQLSYLDGLAKGLAAAGVERYALQVCRTETSLNPSIEFQDAQPGVPHRIADIGHSLFRRFSIRDA
jgi:pyruvate formate lyase activating enzyme